MSEASLKHFAECSWKPNLFNLRYLTDWGIQSIVRKAGEVDIDGIANNYRYELGGAKREQLERWYARAQKEFS